MTSSHIKGPDLFKGIQGLGTLRGVGFEVGPGTLGFVGVDWLPPFRPLAPPSPWCRRLVPFTLRPPTPTGGARSLGWGWGVLFGEGLPACEFPGCATSRLRVLEAERPLGEATCLRWPPSPLFPSTPCSFFPVGRGFWARVEFHGSGPRGVGAWWVHPVARRPHAFKINFLRLLR